MTTLFLLITSYALGVATGLLVYRKHQEKLKSVEATAKTALEGFKK